MLVGGAVEPDGPEADPAAPHIQRGVAVQQRQLDVVQGLFAVAARPPQPYVRHGQPYRTTYNDFYIPFLYMPSEDLGVISTSLFRFRARSAPTGKRSRQERSW